MQHFTDAFQRDASLAELLDAQQLVEMACEVVRAALLALGSVEQADLDVVAHGADWQRGQRAQLVQAELPGWSRVVWNRHGFILH